MDRIGLFQLEAVQMARSATGQERLAGAPPPELRQLELAKNQGTLQGSFGAEL